MKKALFLAGVVLSTALAAQAGVGIQYKGKVTIEGGPQQAEAAKMQKMSPEERARMREMGMSTEGASGYEFKAEADGGQFKMTYLSPFMMFPEGSYLLGDNAAKMAYFVFPDKKQYIEMNINELGAMAKSMKVTYSNEKVSVAPLPPKLIGGALCPGKRINLSYDTEATVMGFHSKSHEEQTTDYYTTDKYDVLALFGGRNWQAQGLATGDAAFDREIQAKVGFLGFPMEIVIHRTANGKDQGTTTLTTSDVQMMPFAPGHFSLPAGYEKTTFMGLVMGGQGEQPQGEKQEARPSLKDLMKHFGGN